MSQIARIVYDLGQYLPMVRRMAGFGSPDARIDYSAASFKGLRDRVISGLHPDRMELEVLEVVRETGSSVTLRMSRKDGRLPWFRAGQYVNLFVELGGVRTSRPYSISSRPGSGTLDLTIREVAGGFVSPWLVRNVKVGDRFESSGPAGHFYYEPLIDLKEVVFIAGGSGITPFLSMLESAAESGWPYKAHLIYGTRVKSDTIFEKRLERLAEENPGFTWDLVVSEPSKTWSGLSGLPDKDLIRARVTSPQDKSFFVCGPPAMLTLVQTSLSELGVPRHRIHTELFGAPADITREPGWPREVAADSTFKLVLTDGRSCPVTAGESLLSGLERAGFVIPALCRSGGCSACRSRLLEGKVFVPRSGGLRESDSWSGYIHPCVSYPLEDLKLRLP